MPYGRWLRHSLPRHCHATKISLRHAFDAVVSAKAVMTASIYAIEMGHIVITPRHCRRHGCRRHDYDAISPAPRQQCAPPQDTIATASSDTPAYAPYIGIRWSPVGSHYSQPISSYFSRSTRYGISLPDYTMRFTYVPPSLPGRYF